jgi:hypothetical protein
MWVVSYWTDALCICLRGVGGGIECFYFGDKMTSKTIRRRCTTRRHKTFTRKIMGPGKEIMVIMDFTHSICKAMAEYNKIADKPLCRLQ